MVVVKLICEDEVDFNTIYLSKWVSILMGHEDGWAKGWLIVA